MRTYHPKENEIERAWHVIDAQDVVLGRLATEVATILQGKNKPQWAPNVDVGDFVVVINAALISAGPRKLADKRYYRHSGYPGGLTEESLGDLLGRDPERVVRLAVQGMLPKSRLGRAMITKLKVYGGANHPHSAQKPVTRALARRAS